MHTFRALMAVAMLGSFAIGCEQEAPKAPSRRRPIWHRTASPSSATSDTEKEKVSN